MSLLFFGIQTKASLSWFAPPADTQVCPLFSALVCGQTSVIGSGYRAHNAESERLIWVPESPKEHHLFARSLAYLSRLSISSCSNSAAKSPCLDQQQRRAPESSFISSRRRTCSARTEIITHSAGIRVAIKQVRCCEIYKAGWLAHFDESRMDHATSGELT